MNACSLGNKQGKEELHEWSHNYTVVGATEVWWDGSHNWSAAADRYTPQERQTRRVCAISVKEQLRCMELFYGTSDWLGESLWSASVERPVKDRILQGQEQSIPIFRKTSKCIKRLAWISSSVKKQHTGGGSRDRL